MSTRPADGSRPSGDRPGVGPLFYSSFYGTPEEMAVPTRALLATVGVAPVARSAGR